MNSTRIYMYKINTKDINACAVDFQVHCLSMSKALCLFIPELVPLCYKRPRYLNFSFMTRYGFK